MKSKMWITTTALCLVALFLALFAGTAQAVANDITGIFTSVPENTTVAGTAIASGGTGPYLYYLNCLSPGADDSRFSITSAGVLTFKTAPNYEIPTDEGVDNIYDVCVAALDTVGGLYYYKSFSISITNVVDDIVLTPQNLATNKPGYNPPDEPQYYGVSANWQMSGADANAANVVSVTVILKDSLGRTLKSLVTKSPAKSVQNQAAPTPGCPAVTGTCGGYSAPFAVKMGTKATSSTWSGYETAWASGPISTNPAASAEIDVLDINNNHYRATISTWSNLENVSWVSMFPVFAYTAGSGGTISGNLSQTVAWGGSGSPVTAVPNSGYHFIGWSDGVPTAARTDSVPGSADITTDPAYSGLSVTASFAKNDITLTPQNLATNKPGYNPPNEPQYYGVSANWQMSGADANAANVVSVTVILKDALGHTLKTLVTSSPAKATANQAAPTTGCPAVTGTCGGYSAPFAVKMGTKISSSTWSPTYEAAWTSGPISTNPPLTADIRILTVYGITYTATISTWSNLENVSWASMFPVFTYTAGAGGTITGNPSQTVTWGGSGTMVTAVPNSGYYFMGWSDGVPTAARTDTVPGSADITTAPPYSGLSVTANFDLTNTISGTIAHSGLLAGGTTIKFDTSGTDYPGTINLSTGFYSIPGIPDGAVGDIVPAYYGGGGYTFSPPSIPGITITGDLPGQNFTAAGARTISGTITGPGGARLPVGAVVDFGSGMTFTQGAGTTTGFTFSGLAPKNYRMGLMNVTYPGSSPFLNNRLYLAVSPMPSKPPTSAPTFNFATTVYGDDAIGNDLMYFWTPFTLSGAIKTPYGANPALKAFNISLVGTGDFAGQSLKGTYNSSNGTFSINTPFTKIGTTITPAAFTGNLLITGTGYQTFTPLGSYTMTASQIAPNVTAYGDRAIYGQFTAGLVPPDGTVIDFGGGLISTVEDGGWFYLPNLERKSYTLKPITEGYFFTANAAGTTQVSITANLASANSDLTGKFFGKAAPLLTFPLKWQRSKYRSQCNIQLVCSGGRNPIQAAIRSQCCLQFRVGHKSLYHRDQL